MTEQNRELVAFGRYIRAERENRGMTPAELAGAAGLEQARLEALEAGRLAPTGDLLPVLAAGLGIDANVLVSSSGYMDTAAVCAAFGRRVRTLREKRGLSQEDLGRPDRAPSNLGGEGRERRERSPSHDDPALRSWAAGAAGGADRRGRRRRDGAEVRPRSEPDPVLSATVRRLREAKGLTREALAFRAGITAGSLAQIELARSAPSWTNFRRIARALDLSITRLAAAIEAAERTPDHAG